MNFSMIVRIWEVECYARAETVTEAVASMVATPCYYMESGGRYYSVTFLTRSSPPVYFSAS